MVRVAGHRGEATFGLMSEGTEAAMVRASREALPPRTQYGRSLQNAPYEKLRKWRLAPVEYTGAGILPEGTSERSVWAHRPGRELLYRAAMNWR